MWRYHWLEGHLASFFQHYEPEQRKEASRIAAVHLGREDRYANKHQQQRPSCNPIFSPPPSSKDIVPEIIEFNFYLIKKIQ